MAAKHKEPTPRNPLRKALQLFNWMIDARPEGTGVREMAQILRLPVSTVHRTLGLLEKEGYVQADPGTGRYRLGLEFFRMAHRAAARFPVTAVALPIIRELVAKCQETVRLSLYDAQRQEMVFVAGVDSPHTVRYVEEPNKWVPVYAGATGWAILAFLTAEERRRIYQRGGLAPITERTITDPASLELALEEVRKRGYAITRGQRTPGTVGLAAPIWGSNGRPMGGLVINIPEQRFDSSGEPALAKLLTDHGHRITVQLGGSVGGVAGEPTTALGDDPSADRAGLLVGLKHARRIAATR